AVGFPDQHGHVAEAGAARLEDERAPQLGDAGSDPLGLQRFVTETADHFDRGLRLAPEFSDRLKQVVLDAVARDDERGYGAQDLGAAAPVLTELGQVLAFGLDAIAPGAKDLRVGVPESID